ncbi:hypothetical protein LTR62_000394 [Meristemomyces frigidus]|uniref:Phosphatidic acid phosphatase type 2/haloperoxidase domain-containing protein n=1 Tax=Meristemomyces frigidus TaxID=1508187 RepID=A0AAN7YM30_9PEZI|nr:hypothetical protein LTR62_000394 [Meristemomyces frigidus]
MARRNKFPVRLTLSYLLDWLAIIAIAAIGGGLNFVSPTHRPFSLLDLSISYPLITESISTLTLVLVSLIAPAIIVLLVVGLFVPGRAFTRNSKLSRKEVLRLKLWEWEKGWAGLALSVAIAFFITQGMKNLFGKPRPDFLSRCAPDLANVAAHVVGGYGQDVSSRWTLVNSGICTQGDKAVLDDGFRSFPSGHSSFSWSGLLYLSLFLCSKFSIAIPYLPISPAGPESIQPRPRMRLPVLEPRGSSGGEGDEEAQLKLPGHDQEQQALSARNTPAHPANIRCLAASPPNYLIIIAFIPIAVAIYISSTRYAQYYHHGFDILSGAFIGILAAVFGFRWYHAPLSRGQGWAYGARSDERAFGVGVGTRGYVCDEVDEAVSSADSVAREV